MAGQGQISARPEAAGSPTVFCRPSCLKMLPALSAAGRETMDPLVACREIDDPEAGRSIGLVWRSTDPRGEDFRTLAGFLRDHAPAGVVRAGRAGAEPRP